MGHIHLLSARQSLFGFSLRVGGMAGAAASGGSMMLRQRGWLIGFVALMAVLMAPDAVAQHAERQFAPPRKRRLSRQPVTKPNLSI